MPHVSIHLSQSIKTSTTNNFIQGFCNKNLLMFKLILLVPSSFKNAVLQCCIRNFPINIRKSQNVNIIKQCGRQVCYYLENVILCRSGHFESDIITNNRENKITIFNSKDLEFILHYITLTHYYILNNTFR